MKAFIKKLARPGPLLAACYAVFALVWLGRAVFCFAWDRAHPEVVLDAGTAAQMELDVTEDGALHTTGADARLVFEGLDVPVRQVLLKARFEESPGEMDVFYTRSEQQDFSAGRGFIGIPGPDGTKRPLITLGGRRAVGRPVEAGWLYALPAGQLHRLRVDLGMVTRNTLRIEAVVLNPRLPASHYFVPDLRGFLAFLLVPALACCAISTIIALPGLLARRGAKARKRG